MKEPLKSRVDKFLMNNLVFIGFCLAAVNFGLWQKSFNAGGFVLIVLTTGHLIYRKHQLERYQEQQFQQSIDRFIQRLDQAEIRNPHNEITH